MLCSFLRTKYSLAVMAISHGNFLKTDFCHFFYHFVCRSTTKDSAFIFQNLEENRVSTISCCDFEAWSAINFLLPQKRPQQWETSHWICLLRHFSMQAARFHLTTPPMHVCPFHLMGHHFELPFSTLNASLYQYLHHHLL